MRALDILKVEGLDVSDWTKTTTHQDAWGDPAGDNKIEYKSPTGRSVVLKLKTAPDVAVGILGPTGLAEHVKEEIAAVLWDELKLALNRDKTQLIHLPTAKARFLGYAFKAATARLRKHHLRRKGSPHQVVQTGKTNVGTMKLLVPLRDLPKKLKQ